MNFNLSVYFNKMNSPNKKEILRQKIADSGKIPKRYTFLVKLTRRVLWPFMRPYFYALSDNLLDIEARLIDMEARLLDIEARLIDMEDKIKVSGIDTGNGITDINCLRTDLVSLKNRLSILEE